MTTKARRSCPISGERLGTWAGPTTPMMCLRLSLVVYRMRNCGRLSGDSTRYGLRSHAHASIIYPMYCNANRPFQQMYHVKAMSGPPPGGLDLNIADEDEFSPDKLRSNVERLYMTVIIGLIGFGKHIARLRSWREPRRTAAFCAVSQQDTKVTDEKILISILGVHYCMALQLLDTPPFYHPYRTCRLPTITSFLVPTCAASAGRFENRWSPIPQGWRAW